MFLVRAFRTHQREPVPLSVVNVDMTLLNSALQSFEWSHVVLLTFQQVNSDFTKLNEKVVGMELSIVLLKQQC